MTTAWFFPGQGTHRIGMGSLLRTVHPLVDDRLRAASDLVGRDMAALCRTGPEPVLRRTELAQPAIYAISVSHAEWLDKLGRAPAATAGHSVGELAALVTARALTFEEGLRLVVRRGQIMADAPVGAMVATRGLTEPAAADLAAQAREEAGGELVIAVVNGPRDLVLSGSDASVDRMEALIHRIDGAHVRRLRVSAAFHSPLMSPVADRWRDVVAGAVLAPPTIPVALNATGAIADGIDQIRRAMADHLVMPVRWSASITALRGIGITRGIDCSEKSTLRRVNEELGIPMSAAHDRPHRARGGATAGSGG